MTKEEAKEIIESECYVFNPLNFDRTTRINTALDVAVEALEPKPMENFESTKDHILKLAGDYKCWDNRLTHDEALELCHMLEQKSCEDAISRQAVEKITWEEPSYSDALNVLTEVRDKVRALPSVTPTRKKGKWINKSHTSDCGIKFVASECTCCGKKTFFDCDQLVYKYCPNCGCKMIEGEKE